VIISCCRRLSGKSGDIRTPNVANAWWSASGIRLWDATIPETPSSVGWTGSAYSTGYKRALRVQGAAQGFRRFAERHGLDPGHR